MSTIVPATLIATFLAQEFFMNVVLFLTSNTAGRI
jgi:hypothetical protein